MRARAAACVHACARAARSNFCRPSGWRPPETFGAPILFNAHSAQSFTTALMKSNFSHDARRFGANLCAFFSRTRTRAHAPVFTLDTLMIDNRAGERASERSRQECARTRERVSVQFYTFRARARTGFIDFAQDAHRRIDGW